MPPLKLDCFSRIRKDIDVLIYSHARPQPRGGLRGLNPPPLSQVKVEKKDKKF